MNNTVIEVLDEEHGKKVIEYWKSLGANTTNYRGNVTKADRGSCIFYGVINGIFSNYDKRDIIGANVIKLPEENYTPKFGEKVLVWDNDESKAVERFFVGFISNKDYTVLVSEENIINTPPNMYLEKVAQYKNYKAIPKEQTVELTLEDISNGKGVGVPSHLIRIKK